MLNVTGGGFKMKQKRCQSAHPLNKKKARGGANQILSSSSSAKMTGLQV